MIFIDLVVVVLQGVFMTEVYRLSVLYLMRLFFSLSLQPSFPAVYNYRYITLSLARSQIR